LEILGAPVLGRRTDALVDVWTSVSGSPTHLPIIRALALFFAPLPLHLLDVLLNPSFEYGGWIGGLGPQRLHARHK
jgi:hypothetical protein